MALIVNGFVKDVLQQLPMEFAVEAQKLIAISPRRERGMMWTGKLGEVAACLGKTMPLANVDCVARTFPGCGSVRENDDLIIRAEAGIPIVRRAGPDRFRISEHRGVPTTNEVDAVASAGSTWIECRDIEARRRLTRLTKCLML